MRFQTSVIALLSMTLLSAEIIWTRIFSAEFLYTFAFLIISTAVLGLGTGALLVRLFPRLDLRSHPGGMLSLTGAFVLGGPLLVFLLHIDITGFFASLAGIAGMALVVVLLSLPFVTGGAVLASLFKDGHKQLPRLYTADLMGAAAGVIFSIPMMNFVGTPAATLLAAVPVLLASLLVSRGWRYVFPVFLLCSAMLFSSSAESILHVPRKQRSPVSHVHWDAMSKIKVYDYNADYKGIEIDNAANSPVYRFDGNWKRPDSLRFHFGIDVSWLIHRMKSCHFLSLGAGGGTDVLQALQEGAVEIHAVEVNGYINEMMKHAHLRSFSGDIYNDPRVHVVTEDARSYVRRHTGYFDLIYSLSSNSFAALNSGAFALAENYLFTTDAFIDYWKALTPEGMLMMEHQVYVPRLVSEIMDALRAVGVDRPSEHLAVYALPRMHRKMILLSRKPLTDDIILSAFGPLHAAQVDDIHLLYPAADTLRDDLIARIITGGWEAAAPTSDVDISPCTDDRPYTAQLGLWKNFDWQRMHRIGMREILGFPVASLMIIIIITIICVFAIPLTLLPYLRKRTERLRPVPWLYFFIIGASFMVVEVMLIQRYTLFLGASVYSFATILFTMLVGTAIGSRVSERISSLLSFPALLVFLMLEIVASPSLTQLLASLPLEGRLGATVVLVFPLSFFMGMPFPKAGLRVGELIDWGFAVNGIASVLGSAGVMLIAFAYGIRAALIIAVLLYAIAYLLYRQKQSWNIHHLANPAIESDKTDDDNLIPV